jgi:hypothetical protein
LFFREAVTLPTIIGTALIVAGCIIARAKCQHRQRNKPKLHCPDLVSIGQG